MDNQVNEKIMAILKELFSHGTFSGDYNEDISEFFDSIMLVSLIVEIETEFNFSLNDADFSNKNFSSIQRIANLISKYK